MTVALMLGLLALWFGLAAYISFSLGDSLAAIVQGLLRAPRAHAVHGWDGWFLVVMCAAATLGTVGILLRSAWGRLISLLALGASALWALLIALAPDAWRGVWFSIWVERWVAAIVTLLTLTGFGWLCSRKAKNEFRRTEMAA